MKNIIKLISPKPTYSIGFLDISPTTYIKLLIKMNLANYCGFSRESTEIFQKSTGNSFQNKMLLTSSNALLDTSLKEQKSESPKGMCTPMFKAALFTGAKRWEPHSWSSVDEPIKKMWHVYTIENYVTIKRKSCQIQQHK